MKRSSHNKEDGNRTSLSVHPTQNHNATNICMWKYVEEGSYLGISVVSQPGCRDDRCAGRLIGNYLLKQRDRHHKAL